jgi:hypothetical protein
LTRLALVTTGFCAVLGLVGDAFAGEQFTSVAGGFNSQGCGGAGCWTNYIRVADITGDGSLDVVAPNMGGFFSLPGTAQDLEVFENGGAGTFTSIAADAVGGHVARLRQIAIGDVDGDGDLDMYAPDGGGADADAYFINDGTGAFTDESSTLLPGTMSNAGAARFADIDGDGDLDLIVADGYGNSGNDETLHFYVNDGSGAMTEAAGAAPGEAAGNDIDDIDVADFDRDFDLDVLINPHSGNLTLWLNDGAGVFTSSPFPAVGPQSNFHYNPGVCDVDGDGDLDVFVDNTGGGYTEQLLINDGAAGFTDGTSQVTGNGGADDNGVACADIDNDGDFDAVVINVAGAGSNLRMFTNDGAGSFSSTPGVFPALGCALWAEFGELSGDGRLDVVVGAGECGNQNRVYHATDAVPVDDRAPVILANETIAGPVDIDAEPGALRFAVSDRFVTDDGPQLQGAYAVLFPGGARETVPAVFMGGDLFRVVLPPQSTDITVTYQLCATDPQENTSCTEELTYDVGMGGNPGGTGTDSGSGGSDTGVDDTSGMVDDSGSASMTGATDGMTMGGMTSPGTDGATDGDSTGPGQDDDGGGGCACTTSPERGGGWLAWMLLVPVAIARRSRRA